MRFLGALLLVTVACTSSPVPSQSSDGGYIGFVDGAGNVAVSRPDGTGRLNLTSDATGPVSYQQPTWSLGAERLAWTSIVPREAGVETVVRIAGADGSSLVEVAMPTAPFYFSWSPDGQSLAALGPGVQTLDLFIIDPETGTQRTASSGQPFYFAWSPDSRRLVSHVGNRRVNLLSEENPMEVISEASDGYQAPGWSTRDQLAFVIGEPAVVAGPVGQGTQERRLVVTDVDRQTVTIVHTFNGIISFQFSPDGGRIAYSVTTVEARGRTGVNFGPLFVTSLDGLTSVEVESDPVVLYQWSPDGRSLLYAYVSQTEPQLRWRVWGPEGAVDYEAFVPTSLFTLSYLPFWDQYALSSRLWSPDGSAYVYAAATHDGDRILVQQLGQPAAQVIGDGSVAFWSTSPANFQGAWAASA